jgi:hypothetical protein
MQALGSASDVAFPNDGDNIRDPSGRLGRLAGGGGQSSKSTPLSNLPRQSCRSSLPLLSLQGGRLYAYGGGWGCDYYRYSYDWPLGRR